jgi:hypothetical protein
VCYEISTQIGDDSVRKAEPMQDIVDEVNYSVRCELGNQLVFNPLCKLIDGYQHLSETSGAVVSGPIISRLQQANCQYGGMVIRL